MGRRRWTQKKIGEAYQIMKARASPSVCADSEAAEHDLKRFLRRLGFGRAEEAISEFSRAVGDDAEITKVVLAVFATGTRDEAGEPLCGEVPRCSVCAVAVYCKYAEEGPRIRQMPEHERPREKLMTRGPESLTDEEVVALLLVTGRNGRTALALARELLLRFGNLRGLLTRGAGELAEVAGLGMAKITQLKAALEVHRRLGETPLRRGSPIDGSESVYNHFREWVKSHQEEHLFLLLLDAGNRVLRVVEVAVGTLNASVVQPREVFRDAIREAAAAVILVHNHPSGSTTPSSHDVMMTKRLQEIGKLVGIRVHDHVIISHEGYLSFADEGLLECQ